VTGNSAIVSTSCALRHPNDIFGVAVCHERAISFLDPEGGSSPTAFSREKRGINPNPYHASDAVGSRYRQRTRTQRLRFQLQQFLDVGSRAGILSSSTCLSSRGILRRSAGFGRGCSFRGRHLGFGGSHVGVRPAEYRGARHLDSRHDLRRQGDPDRQIGADRLYFPAVSTLRSR
jgi:hypothetical protein